MTRSRFKTRNRTDWFLNNLIKGFYYSLKGVYLMSVGVIASPVKPKVTIIYTSMICSFDTNTDLKKIPDSKITRKIYHYLF